MGEFKPTILLVFYLFHFLLTLRPLTYSWDYFLDFISTIGLLVIGLYQKKQRKVSLVSLTVSDIYC